MRPVILGIYTTGPRYKDKPKCENPQLAPHRYSLDDSRLAAKVLVESLRRAGPKPTPSGLSDALESLQKFDLGGLEVSYSTTGTTDHSGLNFADLSFIGSDGKFMR